MPVPRFAPIPLPATGSLIASLEAAPSATEAAAQLSRLLRFPERVDGREIPAPWEGYDRHLLHVDPVGRFSVWAMCWAPDAHSPVHDHACWCAFGLYRGRLVDERFRFDGNLRRVSEATCGPGDVGALPAGRDGIHRMRNAAAGAALSIHVYGFDPAVHASSLGRTYVA